MDKVWKPILGYEGIYEASNLGEIRNAHTLKLLKFRINKGYYLVNLSKNKKPKTYMVHRIIGKTFIPNTQNKREINHIDENKLNNRVDNLQWVTPKENSNWGTRNERISNTIKQLYREVTYTKYGRASLKICQVDAQTNKLIRVHDSQTDAMNMFGVKTGNISDCCRGKTKTYKGYRWIYYDDYLKTCNLA